MAQTLPGNSYILKQNFGFNRVFFFGTTGQTVTVNLSKNAGAFAVNAGGAGAVTEIAFGWYNVALTITDTNIAGILAYHCTAASGGPADFSDQVAAQVFTDLMLQNVPGGTAPAMVSSNLKQNSSFVALFFMTKQADGTAAPGLTVAGQRAFGIAGLGPIAGTIQEVGGGWYVLNGAPTDASAAQAAFKMTATGANETDFSLWFQP